MLLPRGRLAGIAAAFLIDGVSAAADYTVIVTDEPTPRLIPQHLTIQAGDTVTWKNVLGTHNVVADDLTFGNSAAPAPWSLSVTFDSAGTIPYRCTLHFSQLGTINVRPRVSANEIALVINAWDMERTGDPPVVDTSNPSLFMRGPGEFQSGVQLPSGVKITGLEISACDATAVPDHPTATLWRCPEPMSPCEQLASVSTTAFPTTPDCSVARTSLVDGPIVDNLNYSYGVRVLTGPEGTRSVRITYRRIISDPPLTAAFTDVPTSHIAFRAVEALAASGITQGCGVGQFCPNDAVTRAQMAIFLARALGLFFPN